VNKNATGLNNGINWANAFISLQSAVDAAAALPAAVPKEIWIAEGTYRPSETGVTSAYFQIAPNTSHTGGFAGDETNKDQRNPALHPVIIDGELNPGVYSTRLFAGSSLSGDIVFEDMSFKNAHGTSNGAAISVSGNSNVTIRDCLFNNLKASNGGSAYRFGTVLRHKAAYYTGVP
jgi:hypothetical protein